MLCHRPDASVLRLRLESTAAPALLALSVAIGMTSTLSARDAFGKDKAGAPAKPESGESPELEKLKKQLAGEEDDVVAALTSIAETDNVEAAPLVAGVLDRGGTTKVLDEALKTAAKLKASSLSPAIAPYVQHRSEDVRRAAVRALLKTKGPAAVEALRKGLRSSDAAVRGTSATGLGALGVHDALDDLFAAFDHGVAEAAAAIGQLCRPEECEKFAERTGHVTFDIMVTGFDQILFRPPSEIPDEEKIRLVGRLRELGTPEVGKYLTDVGERWPKDWSKKIKQAIDAASHAIGGGSKK